MMLSYYDKIDLMLKTLLPQSEHKRALCAFKDRKDYESQLKQSQLGLIELHDYIHRSGKKLILVLEGHDAAGKGGVIRRLSEYLDPRGIRVHAIGKPTTEELGQHYFERFFHRLPKPGTICVFDRSWYGRVLVERVEKLVPASTWKRAYTEINQIEKMLIEDGMIILKYLLDISYEEQGRRFIQRQKNPLKSWKLTKEDHRNRGKWNSYYKAYQDMLENTSTKACPWTVVAADSKWNARVQILKNIQKRAK